MRPIPDDVQNFLAAIASEMTSASFNKDESMWRHLYQELKSFYEEKKLLGSLHPAVVETLADYTENKQDAVRFYEEALAITQPDEPHYMILISMSEALARLGQKEIAKRTVLDGLHEACEKEDYYYISEAERVLKELNE
jgi:hypothetical protein